MRKAILLVTLFALAWPVLADEGQRDSLNDSRQRNQLQRDVSSDRATTIERRQSLNRSEHRDERFDERQRRERQLKRSQRRLEDSQRELRNQRNQSP
ncbi:hypothetical protein HLV40_11100 [Chromohalobacter salexigens]|uniref:hypothetical protein n=1 Tax=Chromohalobacter TaxID=42054 RepID=UPI00045CC75A|nr:MULTISPECIES: hypothetical protein [Chromohalobacter]MCK2041738.1 hypothetical protein [Chromohalobacter moromii]MCT8513886.1 hypothetical protein [Chromohalobacter sp. TMW 2.2271]NWO10944.1 hypothetical protein [Chromohalobacter salexigens]CDQ33297.1 hypothetical protein BN993_02737 [Virgibacillus halodenitrificans]